MKKAKSSLGDKPLYVQVEAFACVNGLGLASHLSGTLINFGRKQSYAEESSVTFSLKELPQCLPFCFLTLNFCVSDCSYLASAIVLFKSNMLGKHLEARL